MRLAILITILFFYVTPIYTQEGSKIDLKNVNVASERLPTIFLFGDEYTVRDRSEFLSSLLKSHFYRPDLKIVIDLEEFISKRIFSFKHNGAIKINVNSKRLRSQNAYNVFTGTTQQYKSDNNVRLTKLINNIKTVRIDSSLEGVVSRRALKNEIYVIQRQLDSLNVEIKNDTIIVDKRNEKELKRLLRKKTKLNREFDRTPIVEINIFTN